MSIGKYCCCMFISMSNDEANLFNLVISRQYVLHSHQTFLYMRGTRRVGAKGKESIEDTP